MNQEKPRGKAEAGTLPPATRVRDRIFRTARELFSRQGIRAVGVDAIACEAGTNKMSFYRSFASKDALVAECLRAHEAEYWQWWERVTAPHAGDARAQIEALFEDVVRWGGEAASSGCGFNNAAVELRGERHPGLLIVRAFKAELRRRLRALAAEAGAADAEALGDALLLLLEGGAATRLTFEPGAAPAASSGTIVRRLLDAQLPARRSAVRRARDG